MANPLYRALGLAANLALIGTALATASCSSSPPPAATLNPFETPKTYFGTMTAMTIEVAYETGAEPFVGNGFAQPLWNFLKTNLAALFQGRALVPSITVPTTLAQMKSLPAQNKNTWTSSDLNALATAQRTNTTTATNGDFFVVFLNGYLDNGSGGANPSILGVQLTGTTVIAIFKPVITAASSGSLPYVGKYIEQSTLVHEVGHALGLVNNGLPMAAAHQDTANGAHCSNTACTMYWQNEGASAAKQFVLNAVLTGNEIIYGSECLTDARSYAPGG